MMPGVVPVLVRYINIAFGTLTAYTAGMCLSLCLGHNLELSLSCVLTASLKTIH